MQSVVNTATNLAYNAAGGVAQVADTALAYTGLKGHSHAEEHHGAGLPPDSKAGEIKKMDEEGLAVFANEEVRHEVLVKINQLAKSDRGNKLRGREDAKHGLKEVAALDLVTDSGNRGIDFYHPQRYYIVQRPYGLDYIGEVEVEAGKAIHVRCHKASPSAMPTFHSIDTRPGNEGGAVFKTGEPMPWFDY